MKYNFMSQPVCEIHFHGVYALQIAAMQVVSQLAMPPAVHFAVEVTIQLWLQVVLRTDSQLFQASIVPLEKRGCVGRRALERCKVHEGHLTSFRSRVV